MECIDCKKRPATLHFTQIINGQKTEVYVCETCAKNKGYINSSEEAYSLHELLTGLFNFSSSQMGVKQDSLFSEIDQLTCNQCNLTFHEFQRIGKFGCAQCYEAFKSKLDSLFRRVHSGNTRHNGKIPKRRGGKLHVKKEIELYRNQLQQLITNEEFEKAAVVRDLIKKLENQKEGGHS